MSLGRGGHDNLGSREWTSYKTAELKLIMQRNKRGQKWLVPTELTFS
jgi:hypothetical protein